MYLSQGLKEFNYLDHLMIVGSTFEENIIFLIFLLLMWT
ncbi:hypothetical protein X924_07875 [Petrotoga sp. 9PWA.NaAc.5.4]|nr:hypothetical protein X924_07875 [Petrotoga sp. 9PWA.NaAc.5.4]